MIPADATSVPPVAVVLDEDPSKIAHPTSKLPLALILGGAGIGVVGGVLDVLVVGPARKKLDTPPATVQSQIRDRDAYALRRDIVVGCYVAAGLAVAAGLVLRATVLAPRDVTPIATVTADQVVVGVTWSR